MSAAAEGVRFPNLNRAMPVEYHLAVLFLKDSFSTEINLSLSDCLYVFM